MQCFSNEKWVVCRVCLGQPDESMETIFDKNDDKDMTHMILECGGVPIKRFDQYPDKICSNCLKYLRVAYKFRMICQRSHKHLSKLIASVVTEIPDENDGEFASIEVEEKNDKLVLKGDLPVLKTEPEENLCIKQEIFENVSDAAVVDVYEKNDKLVLKGDLPVLKTEPEENLCIKQEIFENVSDAAVVDVLNEDDVDSFEEFGSIDEAVSELSEDIKHLADISGTEDPHISKEDYSPVEEIPKRGRESPPKSTPKTLGRKNIKTHMGIKRHECEICGRCYARTNQLAYHVNTHRGNRPYKCLHCPVDFAHRSMRDRHERIHINQRPCFCDVCDKWFSCTRTFKHHNMIHNREKLHVCDICGKRFLQPFKLLEHKAPHLQESVNGENENVREADL